MSNRKYPRLWTEARLAVLRDLIAGGATLSLCAQHFGVSREAIGGACDRNGIQTLNKKGFNQIVSGVAAVTVVAAVGEPSAAMLRLAEFDPVVRRALRMRAGEPVELDLEVDG